MSDELKPLGHTDDYHLEMAALDMYPVEDALPKSTSVVFRIHQLGRERAAGREVLQAVLDAIAGTLDTSTEIADHPNVKFAQMQRLQLLAGATPEGQHDCPHCKLPPVLPEQCTPEIHAVIEEQIAMDGKMFYAGMEHEAKYHIIQPLPAPAQQEEKP
jgi:hypothetical protein